MNHSEMWTFLKSLFSQSSDFCFTFFLILPLGSGSVDPHILADLDQGSQNRGSNGSGFGSYALLRSSPHLIITVN